MIQALSIVGDVFWIIGLALMASMSWAAHRKIPAGTSTPVAWNGTTVLARAPKIPALWLVPCLAFLLGAWMKFESGAPDLDSNGAIIWLLIRATVAPMLVLLQLNQILRGLKTLDAEGAL
jgi:hypothetical protein